MRASFRRILVTLTVATGSVSACNDQEATAPPASSSLARSSPMKLTDGREIFRFDDFGNWRFWTDSLRLNDLVEGLTPNQALALGLQVDATMIPAPVLEAVLADPALLDDPATTRALRNT
jgi:hypothetical protein